MVDTNFFFHNAHTLYTAVFVFDAFNLFHLHDSYTGLVS